MRDTHNKQTHVLYRYETKDTHNIHTNKLNSNDLYRYETKDTHNIHTNKLYTMTFIDMRPKTHISYTQTN